MNPVMFKLFGFSVRWYSVLILIGIGLAYLLINSEARRHHIKSEFMFNLMFWAIILGILGARAYYVIFNLDYYLYNPTEIYKVWNGGLAIHGGMLAGLITILVYCKKYKVNTKKILDICVVALILAQAIGRWGNFFNQEAHGAATTVSHLKALLVPDFVIKGMTIDGVVYSPTFFYESIVCLLAFIILLFVRRGKYIKVGTLTASYLITYGVLRFFIEMSRTDALMIGPFRMAQIVSVIMVIVGLGMMMLISKKNKFEDLCNDPDNMDQLRF